MRNQQKTHQERSQPASRAKLGLLEKHKDYVLRAKDYNFKRKRLNSLQHKAYFRNPDEFYYKMISTKTKGGVHIAERNEKFDHEFLTLLKTQDQNYVNYQRMINQKKMEKLKQNIHLPNLNTPSISNNNDTEDDDDDEEEEQLDQVNNNNPFPKKLIFVDDDNGEVIPQSVSITTTTRLLQPKESPSFISLELAAREKREIQLRKIQLEMQIQKDLMNNKGSKKKVGMDKQGLPIYKWRNDRKK